MIIRGKDKVQVGSKSKSVWVLDTDALTELDCYLEVDNLVKGGLESIDHMCAREPIYEAMVYV